MPIQVPVTQTGLEASIQAAAQRAGRNLKIDLGVSSRSIGGLSQPLGKITGQADQFTKSMEAANARVLAFGASVGVLSAVAEGFKSIITTTIQVEKSLADINSVLGANTAQLNKFKNDIFSVAKETGNSFQTVSDAALELSRQGLKSDEVLRRLKDSMVLSRLSGLDAASAVEGLTAAVNSFSKEGLTTTEVLNKIAKTAAAYSVSERDLVEGFKRSASVAQQAGVSIDELGAVITAVQQKTARGGAVIGNAFKTIFTRIRNPESLQALQEIGVSVTNMQGGLLPATKLIENLADKMNVLSDAQKQNATLKIAGGFQIGPLLALLDDINSKTSVYKEAVGTMGTAANEAYTRNTALNKTLAASINEATVNLQELANTLGEIGVTDSLKNILSFFNSFATNVKDLLQGEGLGSDFAKGIVKGIGGILSGPGLLLFGAIIAKLSINFVQFGASALKTFFNIGSAAKEIGAIQSTIASTLLNNKSIQTQILALEGDRLSQAKFFSTALNTQLATMEKMRTIAASIAPAVYGATTGAGKPRAAGGYMPTVMAEANDINKGVGGARSSDRPVIIPNFNFGGGKKGTMVANTGEHIVPNYGGGGGSAIFNRDMVGRMGLPSNAQKINSANGFIPNFAQTASAAEVRQYADNIEQYRIGNSKTFKFPSGGTMAESQIKNALSSIKAKSLGNLAKVNAGGVDFGMIVGEKGTGQMASRYADDKGRITLNPTESSKYLIDVPIHRINDKNLKFKESTKITEQLSKVSASVALKMAKDLSGGQIPNPENIQLIESLLNKGALTGTSGAIFEAGIAGILKDKDFSDFSSQDRGSLIDFKPYGRIKELFGIQSGQSTKGLEAKANSGPDLISSVAGKILKVEKGQSAFGKAASGYIPNFANYVYDSDKLPAELRASILPAILASKKRKDGILAPAGAGKSTMAGGIGQFIQSMEDVAKATGFTILSAAGLAKTPTGISKQFQPILDSIKRSGGSLKYLNVDNEEIKRRREARVATGGNDLRSEAQLKGTSYAPLNQPEFLDILKKEMGGNLQIVNGASGYVPNFVNESYITDTLKRIKDGTSGFSKQEQEMFLKKFGASAKVGNKGISLRKVFDTLDSENGISAMVDKAYRAAGPTASMDQVFQVFSKQIAANPEGLRNLVKQKGFIPNFADPLKEAISREVGAGVDPSQVYVDQHSSLKNSGNPMGLMVANRRDEPAGGFQGINRARKEGANAQMYGAAGGFVPNYADSNLTPYVGMTRSKALEEADKQYEQALKKQIAVIDADIKATESKLGKVKVNGDAYKKHTDTLAKLNLASNNLSSDMQKENELVKKAIIESTKGVLGTGITATLREARVSEPKEKGSKDMLGTIFALQAGFSALSGATSDATSKVGKYSNIVSEGLSSGTTAVFALQGLGTALPKFAGFLGPAGLAIGALTAAWQIGTEIYNEQSGINRTVAESLDRVGKAAAEASTNLDKLSPEGKKKVEEQAQASVRQSLKTGRTYLLGEKSGGGDVGSDSYRTVEETANFAGDVTDELKDNLFKMQAQALGAGVSVDKLNAEIQKFSKDSIITQDEILQLSSSFNGFIDDLKKTDIEIKKLNLNPNEGLGNIIGQMNPQDVEKFINPSLMSNEEKAKAAGYGNFEDYKKNKYAFTDEAKIKSQANPLNFIKSALVTGGMAEGSEPLNNELLKQANQLIGAYRQKQDAILTDSQALNIEYNKSLALLRGQSQYTKIINELENKALGPNNELLDIANNALLTDKKRSDAIEDSNKKFETQNNLIKNQQTAYEGLRGDLEKTLSGAGLKIEDFDKVFTSISEKTNSFSEDLRKAFANNDFAKIEDISKKIGSSLDGVIGKEGLANDGILKYITSLFAGEKKINDQASLLKTILGITRQISDADKDRNDNLSKRNELIQNSIQLAQQSKDLEIKQFSPDEFAKRKKIAELGQPKLNETSLQALKREAEQAKSQRELQPIDQSRAVQEIQQRYLRNGIQQATSLATKGVDATEVAGITDEIAKATDLEQLRGKYGKEFNDNLDKIIANRNTEIDQLTKSNNLEEKGLSLAEQKLKAIQSGVPGGLESGLTKLRDENEMFAFNLGERIPQLFADNMASAMEGVIMQGKSLGDSLRAAASSFLNEITKAQIKNIAGQFTGGVGTLFKASGGPITGGSGNKDDVPAMLMGGEYVMNKKAVSKYGSGFMEALNNGSISGYARGGPVIRDRGLGSDVINASNVRNQTGKGGFQMPGYYGAGTISGKKNLLSYASQSYTSGAGDIIRGGGDSSYIDLTPESVRLTNFGRNQGPMAAAVKESKKEALGLYFQQLAAEKQAREEEKAQKKAFKTAIISALITSAVSAGVGITKTGFQEGFAKTGTFMGGVKGVGEKFGNVGSSLGSLFSGDFKSASQYYNMATTNFENGVPKALVVNGGSFGESNAATSLNGNFVATAYGSASIDKTTAMDQEKANLGVKGYEGFSQTLGASGRTLEAGKSVASNYFPLGTMLEINGAIYRVDDTGGMGKNVIDFFAGSDKNLYDKFANMGALNIKRLATGGAIPQTSGIDTVPAMLSGGEFIMNAGATRRIGANNLNAMNSGASTDTSSSAINDQLINKIDELIRVTKESSKPVTVNVSSQQGQTSGDNQQDGGSQKDQNLSKKIRDAVVQVLQEEKRLGGVLRRS